MSTVDPGQMYTLGHSQGGYQAYYRGPSSAIVILAFGQPLYENGIWGTYLFSDQFASLAQIETAAIKYAEGFWFNTPVNGPKIRIAIGTSNYVGSSGYGQVNYEHGKQWALMVNRVGNYVRERNWNTQITISGANDIEVGWSTPLQMRNWLAGYDSSNFHAVYDFGDAAGCYPYNNPAYPDSCGNGWTRLDVWWKAYGSTISLPMPEIYYANPTMAGQWQKLSLWSFINYGYRINFAGALTHYDASNGCCSLLTPQQGWSIFWDKLNADSRTAQGLGWSSDMTYDN